jgi:hypothetical protein
MIAKRYMTQQNIRILGAAENSKNMTLEACRDRQDVPSLEGVTGMLKVDQAKN